MKNRIILVLIFMFMTISQINANSLSKNNWLTFTQATKQVQKTDRPIMLVVYLDSCPVCSSWFSAIAQSPNYFKAMKHFVIPAKMEERSFLVLFGSTYQIKTVPAFFFFDKNGVLLSKFEGAPNNPEEFLKWLYRVKNYKKFQKNGI